MCNCAKGEVPPLAYCKENVIAIFRQFEKARSLGSKTNSGWTLEALMKRNALLRTRQNCLSKIRNDEEGSWGFIKEDLFRALIRILHEKGQLALRDDHLLLQAIPGHFHHALNCFFNKEDCHYDLKSLAGRYHCYQPAILYDDKCLIGNCIISYDAASNSLMVKTVQHYTLAGASTRKHFFEGTIVRSEGGSFVWIDRDDSTQRLVRGNLEQASLGKDEEEIISMNAWCVLNFQRREVVRRLFLERLETGKEFIKTELYDYKVAPAHLQPFLTRNSSKYTNVVEL